jgi:SagB-type dehydrogenase family enzyme
MDFSGQEIGLRFQEETKYMRSSSLAKLPERTSKTVASRMIGLPSPLPLGEGPDFWKVLQKRRSIRDYTQAPLALTELSGLLWATQGITRKASASWYRTAPSAGALHPIDTYLAVHRVEGLDPGIYFFGVDEFTLEMKRMGNFSPAVARAALAQEMVRAAAVVFVWVAVIRRSSQKYRQRAYRYIYLDCGHIGQNLYLAATAMNLGCCGIAAFFDDEINDLVGVDGREETAIYLATVGKK